MLLHTQTSVILIAYSKRKLNIWCLERLEYHNKSKRHQLLLDNEISISIKLVNRRKVSKMGWQTAALTSDLIKRRAPTPAGDMVPNAIAAGETLTSHTGGKSGDTAL